jgi:hypothetical protein
MKLAGMAGMEDRGNAARLRKALTVSDFPS